MTGWGGLTRRQGLVLALVWVLSAAYLALRADRGFIPHDEGLVAQAAERVLLGELPHRDFDDTYTGGLAWLHALAFALFGVELRALRIVLFLFACAFIPVVYRIASRFAPPLVAALVTLTCVVWSVPNYFAGLPSWYNLFFATFGTFALLRFIETERRGWLVVAGLWGGLAIVVKTIGLYYVAAALLFLLYREQLEGADEREPADEREGANERAHANGLDHAGGAVQGVAPRFNLFSTATIVGLVLFAALVSVLVARQLEPMAVVQFAVPACALAGFLVWNESRCVRGAFFMRLRVFARLVLPFAAGVLAPIVVFLVPYVATDSVASLLHGVFVLPRRRFEFVVFSLPPVGTLVAALPLAALLCVPLLRARRGPHGTEIGQWGHSSADRGGAPTAPRTAPQRVMLALASLALAGILALGASEAVYRGVWYSVRPIVVLAVVAGVALLVTNARAGAVSRQRRLEVFLLVAVAALTSLVQFPYAFGIYFCYAAPLAILALVAVVREQERAPRALYTCVLVFYLLFGVVWVNRGFMRDLGGRFTAFESYVPLAVARAGIRVPAAQAELYRRLVAEIHAHSGEGDFIYATPDCPEVYFLSGRRNPTRTFYDLFDTGYATDFPSRRRRILALLERHNVNVVLFHWHPEFSRTFDPDLFAALAERFPHKTTIAIDAFPGPDRFTVRWRG